MVGAIPSPNPGEGEPEVLLECASTPSLVVQVDSDRIALVHGIGRTARELLQVQNEKDARDEESEKCRRI